MPTIRPFRGIRPVREYAGRIVVRAEDASSGERAAAIAEAEPLSFLHVASGEESVTGFVGRGYMAQDAEPSLYIYRISGWGHVQTGLICLVDARDYDAGLIKKHELLRDEKRDYQIRQIERLGGNCEPVLLTCDTEGREEELTHEWTTSHEPDFDLYDRISFRHTLWAVSDPGFMRRAVQVMAKAGAFYICDGHHRVAAAAKYAEMNRGNEAAQSFMAAIFPSEEMQILDYNRVVRDLNGMTPSEFTDALRAAGFSVEQAGDEPVRPARHGEYMLVMGREWYRLERGSSADPSQDPVGSLDVSALQNRVLGPLLGIHDPKKDERLAFVKGTEGIEALEDRVHAGMAAGFALFPVGMDEIIKVADAGLTMPPKSTCFSPKPLNGLVMYHFR